MDCGPRCLKHVLQIRFNENIRLRRAIRLCKETEDGTTLERMAEAFAACGHDAKVSDHLAWEDLLFLQAHRKIVVVDWWSDLDAVGKPGFGDGHFSVVEHVSLQTLRLWDPDINGARTLPRAFFEARWYDWDYADARRNTRIDRICAAVIVNRSGINPEE